MSNKVKPIPEGYHTVTPYMYIRDAASAIEFYKKAFNAKEIMCMKGPDGKVKHAEIRIGNSPIMVTDEWPECGALSPQTLKGSAVSLYLYVEDVDALFKQAIAAGGKEIHPVKDQFYGDRSGGLTDPFGHVWYLATHKEDMSEEELMRRAKAAMTKETCS
jgi:PhnB protein